MDVNENKRRRSASQLKMFRSCPEQFRLVKLVGHGKYESAAAIQGSAFHEVAEALALDVRFNVRREFYQIYDTLVATTEQKAPRREWRVFGRGNNVENDIASRRESGAAQCEVLQRRMISDHWNAYKLPDGSPAVEVSFSLELSDVRVIGKIDRIESDGVVRDLKTGVRETTPMQLGLYALAARECVGVDSTVGDFYYAKDDTYSDLYDLRRFTREYFDRHFSSMENIIKNGLFLPSPGGECFICPVKAWCSELGHKKEGM